MITNKRTKPLSLSIMESLERRTTLSRKHTNYLNGLQKGFEGELSFDCMTEELGTGCIVIKDLFLQPKLSNAFQIDTLMVIGETLYLYEIKNYSGDYCYGAEMLLKRPDFELSNPLIQLQSTKNKLKLFLNELGHRLQVKAYVVYVHPEFTLFHAPENETNILPSQIKRHFANLKIEIALAIKVPKKFVEDLMMYKSDPPLFTKDFPEYSFTDLKKGMVCEGCGSFELIKYRQTYRCKDCGYKNTIHSTLLNAITEYQQLFPDSKLSTRIIYDWCDETVSKKRVKRALNELSIK